MSEELRAVSDLRKEAESIREKLARIEDEIRRREHDLWAQHMNERHAAIAAIRKD
jgi:hypothetical protein